MSIKLAYIGGGSMFVPSIVNGIGRVMQQAKVPFEAELALYDIRPEKAERMRAYVEIVSRAWNVPIRAIIPSSRIEALKGADVVFISVWLQEEQERLHRILESLDVQFLEPDPALSAIACAPWCLDLVAELEVYCPGALFVTLMNPTDVLAGVVARGTKMRAAGLCVEVDQLRAELAHYFDVPFESIEMKHAGVNHDGWVLGLKVSGQDGYALWRDRWEEIERHPDVHPDNVWIRSILELTGHLRTSGHHHWPYTVEITPEHAALCEARRGRLPSRTKALDEALQTGTPITDPPSTLTCRSKLHYPYTGLSVGKLLQSVATGQANIIPLQVTNCGAISNFPDDVIVEVPTLVVGQTLRPVPVGAMPEWLGGYTRLLAVQRGIIAKYVLDPNLLTLKRALATLPMFGTVQQLNRLAEALHQEFGGLVRKV